MDAHAADAVEVRDLVVVRGGNRVLDGVSLTVRHGSVTGLLGPSGAGKTTLMRCVVGIQVLTSGTVRVLGSEAGQPELRRRVGYVTQSPSVYGDLTVVENLRYFAAVAGAPPARVTEVLTAVAMERLADRIVGSLSGGERARVSLAVALLGEPELLVLDEPTVGLDPVLRRDLWKLFHRLAHRGTTLLVSSHVMDEAARCTDLLLLRDGRLLADGTPAQIEERTGAADLETSFLYLGRAGAGRGDRAVNPRVTAATARRVLTQLRRDPRTIALLLAMPCVLVVLTRYVFAREVFDRLGPAVLGLFPLVVMFAVTAVTTLRERTAGTLERLLTMPTAKLDLLVGYALAFGAAALIEVGLLVTFSLTVLGLDVAGPVALLVAVAVLGGLLGMALGLFVSVFARTEFQVGQFMPAFVLPQLLMSGLFVPRSDMSAVLRWLSDVFPMTYVVDAMQRITGGEDFTATMWRDLAILAGACVLALALGAATLRRRAA